MRKRLKETVKYIFPDCAAINVYSSFDIIGDIAITKLPVFTPENARAATAAITQRHKNIKVVFVQSSAVTGEYRVRSLSRVFGENRTCTVHKENGCQFEVDVEKCYFSPRLSHERLRVAKVVQSGETVVNMFAGVGCFSILIAKQVPTARVFSIDINPVAVQYMQRNILLNRVFGRVIPMLGDAEVLIKTQLEGLADRVLMPLPEKSLEYLHAAVSALKLQRGWLHVHTFEHATKTEDPAQKTVCRLHETLAKLNVDFEVPHVRIVRSTGPNWWHLVADVLVLNRYST
ncbi:MAG: class I SAM-dependent methyltransferase family protein [Candidatus Bathyarchaeota archaeon]|nr:class I SAM-dependent methyltransferase family protein [Candidatus Bathyarchaeota archaeon]